MISKDLEITRLHMNSALLCLFAVGFAEAFKMSASFDASPRKFREASHSVVKQTKRSPLLRMSVNDEPQDDVLRSTAILCQYSPGQADILVFCSLIQNFIYFLCPADLCSCIIFAEL
jgi:hypothetical protein